MKYIRSCVKRRIVGLLVLTEVVSMTRVWTKDKATDDQSQRYEWTKLYQKIEAIRLGCVQSIGGRLGSRTLWHVGRGTSWAWNSYAVGREELAKRRLVVGERKRRDSELHLVGKCSETLPTNRTNVSENAIVGFRTIRRPSPINGDDDENEKAGIFLIGLQARASPAERPLLRILLENLRTEFAQKAIHALVL
ncbi:hypothetical protein V1477_010132 [Vespula maculifrons]|uniref:Uncharacterized protein n=1 Tax=Vespula maculifrons TaxID=7453 RepID=A0ABD2CDY6_VESMC